MSFDAPSPSSSRGIFAEIVRIQREGRRAVLATPIWSSGSVPLCSWSKLLFREDGSIRGTIGGGLLEAQVIEASRQVISEAKPQTLEFDMAQDEAARSGMICGGRCSVLVEPIAPGYSTQAFAAAARAEEAGEPIVLVTLLPPEEHAQKLAFSPEGEAIGSTPELASDIDMRDSIRECCATERPCFVEAPIAAHIDPLLPLPSLFVFGGGHVAIPVAHMAQLVGFRVVVIDDREEFADRRRFPGADEVLVATVPDAFSQLPIDEHSYVVAVARGHVFDEDIVAEALQTPARYIGMIGSQRKADGVLERLRRRGFSEEDLDRIHSPIGLRIDAETVEEIAVSIVAELVAVRREAG
jgi:xanthine dehydrogenase accessory factor